VNVRTKLLVLSLLFPILASAACARAPKDQGAVASLTVDIPKLIEVRGAQVWLLRRADEVVIALWGISPIGGADGRYRCFIQDRLDHPFDGETRPFLDPCRQAWWSRDGRFLGYTRDGRDVTADGPALVRIPVAVREGRVLVDTAHLDCRQRGQMSCD